MPGGRRLWRFSDKGDHFVPDQELTLTSSETAPFSLVGKDWQSLVRPKLNIAWLPADKVFFRAVQLPGTDPAEIKAMVELQLEKLSPLPVTHIVWSFYLVPRPAAKPDALQNVIVVVALRSYVEEFLGQLQSQGFQPDRIEPPGLDQLLSARMQGDGVWIIPSAPADPLLIVWQYGGAIQNVSLLPLPAGGHHGDLLKAHIAQIAWAGEMEGWLASPPRIHLVASKEQALQWEPLIAPWAENAVEILAPASPAELAAQSAERAGNGGESTNLLPPEFAARYHQQLVDRLWMRGIMSVVAVYLFGVLFYFALLYGRSRTYESKREEAALLTKQANEAVNDQIQIQIIKERQNLKYAALDCWKAIALNLPESVTLEDMYFTRSKLELRGTSTSDQFKDVDELNEGLRHTQDVANTGPLFSVVDQPNLSSRPGRTDWNFTCSLRSSEEK
jgi:hypothetical protein